MGGRNAGPDGPARNGDDGFDAAWAEIVADLTAAGPSADDEARSVGPGPEPSPEAPAEPEPPTLIWGSGPRDWEERGPSAARPGARAGQEPDEDDGDGAFVPPTPGPVLGGDPLLTLAWIGVVVAPVLLLLMVVVWPAGPSFLRHGAGVVLLMSFAVLVWRMPHRRDDDDDAGAVV